MSQAPELRESVVETYARYLVDKASDEARVMALRAHPAWAGPTSFDIDGQRVLVRGCPSSLAVREAFIDLSDADYLVVLTDQDAEALGESLTTRFWHQRVEMVDPWRSVADLFSARAVASEVKSLGSQFAEVLADSRPMGGYPTAPTGVVTADVAMRGLLNAVLKTESVDIDSLLTVSGDQEAKARWQRVPATVRDEVGAWARDGVGMVAPLILDVLAGPTRVDAVTVGLAADVIYRQGVPDEAVKAQVRLEEYFNNRAPDRADARAFANSCIDHLGRLPGHDASRAQIASRAQQLLVDVKWPEGARSSLILPEGYATLARELATHLLDDSVPQDQVEDALRSLEGHEQAESQQRAATQRARMAVRLRRWLAAHKPEPVTLAEALARQVQMDAWVDMALADVFTGSSDPLVSDAYRHIVARVRVIRDAHDAQFAALLADALREGPEGVVGVEEVLARVVQPISQDVAVLLIVVDGMSAAVAAELSEGIERRGWSEMITGTGRLPVLAALPTVTRFSRTSLFSGALLGGGQADEKAAFAAILAGARVFHKDDLRAPAGEELARAVREAIQSSDRVVGVVLNTVDDALAKADPGGSDWTVESIQHLPALLDLASAVGRTVILTSDHGHVVERGTERLSMPGADARYRPADSPAGAGEVLLEGSRVLAHGGRIVAPVREDIRYGNKAAGYHGGASAAEVTIPLLVFSQFPDALAATGWRPATPQTPDWWIAPAVTVAALPRRTPPVKRPSVQVEGQESLFREPVGEASLGAALAEQLLASALFAERFQRLQRQLTTELVADVVTCLVDLGGRAHKDIVARTAGLPAVRITGAFRTMQRLLNVEGYQVLAMDVDETTLVLDRWLLVEQFGLAS